MKAIILAAGLGTRMGEEGKDLPKCLIEINRESILEIQHEFLKKVGVQEIYVVIGHERGCWNKENKRKIRSIIPNVITNYENVKTKNAYSLKLALDVIADDDLLILDGDLVFSFDLIRKLLDVDDNVLLTKRAIHKEDPNNKIKIDGVGRVIKIGRELHEENLIYGGLIKVKKKDISLLRSVLAQEKYYNLDTGFLVDELCNILELYPFIEESWVNANTLDDIRQAQKIVKALLLVIMSGYTAVGKSTLARKIAKNIPNTEIFHSAIIRKELNLTPKTVEQADKFFDYRNNLRQEVDKTVYNKLAEKAVDCLLARKNVVLDAGFFFQWQRQLIYKQVKELNPEIFFVRVVCENEEEIKKRLNEREKKFALSPLNETPSWNTYIATKLVTEPVEKDDISQDIGLNIIEFDSFTHNLNTIRNNNSAYLSQIKESLLP